MAEDRIRGRYERNQPLIRQAVPLADWALVFDNSVVGTRPRRIIASAKGRVLRAASPLPAWAQALYGPDLKP